MNRLLLVTVMFTVAACATSSPATDRSESDQTPDLAEAAQPVEAPAPARAGESQSDEMLAQNDAAGGFDGIEEVEAPNVGETPASMLPEKPTSKPAIVCERVVPTGSVLPIKVCRHRSEIKRKEEADRKIFDDIKRNTAIGASRL